MIEHSFKTTFWLWLCYDVDFTLDPTRLVIVVWCVCVLRWSGGHQYGCGVHYGGEGGRRVGAHEEGFCHHQWRLHQVLQGAGDGDRRRRWGLLAGIHFDRWLMKTACSYYKYSRDFSFPLMSVIESETQSSGGVCGEGHRGEEVFRRRGPLHCGDVLPTHHSERRKLQPQIQRCQVSNHDNILQ